MRCLNSQAYQDRSQRPLLARLAGVYSDQCDSIPIAHQIQRIHERRMTGKVYPGDLDKGQPFLHIEDLVDACEKMVNRRSDLPQELTVNIGEDKHLAMTRSRSVWVG